MIQSTQMYGELYQNESSAQALSHSSQTVLAYFPLFTIFPRQCPILYNDIYQASVYKAIRRNVLFPRQLTGKKHANSDPRGHGRQ